MENWKKVLILTLSIFSTLQSVESNGHRQKFGESCSRNDRKCDFTKWLRCGEDGKCVCYQGDGQGPKVEMYYDPISDRCVGSFGTDCSQKFFPFDDEDPHHFHLRGSTSNHWRYGNGSLRCGANAFCDFDGKVHACNCRENFYATEDGKCFKLKSHGDSCTNDKECDPDGYLRCDSKDLTCICEKEDHVLDAHLNKCIVKTGLPCEIRLNRLDKRIIDDCAEEATCDPVARVCRCKMGTQIHSDRSCQRGWGQECDPHEYPCGDSKLNCRSKVCQCKYPLHMKYDHETGQCVSIVSGPCGYNDSSELAIQCTTNAECVKSGHHAECRCKSGFLQTVAGDCVKPFGSECELDGDCDEVGPLACINNRCECPDLLLQFEPRTRKCKGLVGATCRTDKDSCIEHASCNKSQASGGNVGRCLCNQGYKETVKHTCSK